MININIKIDDLLPPHLRKQLLKAIYTESIRNARKGRDIQGRPFKPISALTRKARRKKSGVPLNDTGRLLQSLRPTITEDTLEVRGGVVYARIHLYGGTIRPRKARRLTIPLRPEFRLVKARNLELHRRGSVLFTEDGEPAYLLSQGVVIPRRPYLPIEGVPQKILQRLISDILKYYQG